MEPLRICRTLRAVGHPLDREHDHAWTVFAPLFLSGPVFVVPKIGIGNNEARLGRGYWHASPLFPVKERIEMGVPCIHARFSNRLHLLLGQIDGGKAPAAFPEAFEFLVFVRADEVPRDLAVARYRHGTTLGLHAVAAEVSGEL